MTTYRQRVTPGYARLWIRRNWFKAILRPQLAQTLF